MGQCRECGKVVNTADMTYDYCKECITPELEQEAELRHGAMALKKVSLTNESKGDTKEVPAGGSVVNFLFYPIIPFLRKDWLWAVIGVVVIAVTFVLKLKILIFVYALFIGLQYNKFYIKQLLKNGYVPADNYSEKALQLKKIIA